MSEHFYAWMTPDQVGFEYSEYPYIDSMRLQRLYPELTIVTFNNNGLTMYLYKGSSCVGDHRLSSLLDLPERIRAYLLLIS